MNKKAQGLSMNVIIIAAIAIVVLVIMIVIFSSRVQLFGQGTNTCQGTCVALKSSCGSSAPIPAKNCDANGDGTPDVEGAGFCCMEAG